VAHAFSRGTPHQFLTKKHEADCGGSNPEESVVKLARYDNQSNQAGIPSTLRAWQTYIAKTQRLTLRSSHLMFVQEASDGVPGTWQFAFRHYEVGSFAGSCRRELIPNF